MHVQHNEMINERNDRLLFVSAPSASVQVQVEPVGRWFEAYLRRRNRNVSASFQELEEEVESEEESDDEDFQIEEYPILRTLDPKDWKVTLSFAALKTKSCMSSVK